MQRKIAALIASGGPGPFDLEDIARAVYGGDTWSRSRLNSLTRAASRMTLPAKWAFGRLPHDRRLFLYNARRKQKITVRLPFRDLSDITTTIVFELNEGVTLTTNR